MDRNHPNDLHDAVAIIGVAGRFPGAPDVRGFWRNLCEGVESVRSYTAEELRESGIDPTVLREPGYVNAGAALDDADCFDAAFFGIHALEARVMDPQHRVFLECAWEVLEDAGYDPETYPGLIGIFGGVARNTYLFNNVLGHEAVVKSLGSYQEMLSSDKEYAVTRVAYKFNLKGPSINVQTACSTSGVAIHLACQSLQNGDCDLALAGGARIRVPVKAGYFYEEGGIPSPDGHCRAFDADAKGTVIGSGVALVALKLLPDALRDRDNIYAVIRGSAINNDGSAKVGFTAPSIQGQAAVVSEAIAAAGVDADSIHYVETHGTGTSVGDPIEVAALTKAFRESTPRNGFCAIGSVKTNIGHLDAGAGVAGIIKAAMGLRDRKIPPSLNYERPNPQIDFDNSPFFVNTKLTDWETNSSPRRAGVSSFGLGGTNAHIVLEEAPEAPETDPSRAYQLVLLSARSEAGLESATARLANHLRSDTESDFPDVAYTLQVGRRRFDHRRAVVCRDAPDAISALDPVDRKRVYTDGSSSSGRQVVLMFPGGGAQYPNMGRELYQTEPAFRRHVDECLSILEKKSAVDLKALMFPEGDVTEDLGRRLEQPSLALPALFATEYALARLWESWGVRPSALIGHSMGEYTAACLAGVMSLEDTISLILLRGRLFETLPSGSMLGVALSEEELRPLMVEGLSIAAVNLPDACVVSGPTPAIERMEKVLESKGLDSRRLHISVAAHSAMVEPILEEFRDFARGIDLRAPQSPYVSNVTGTWITESEATDPDYWVRHLRQTVRFSEGLETLLSDTDAVFLETGPGQILSGFARQQVEKPRSRVVSSMRHPKETVSDLVFLLNSLGRLWVAGVDIDWAGYYAEEKRRRVSLPAYPFERKKHWLEPVNRTDCGSAADEQGAAGAKRILRAQEQQTGESSMSQPVYSRAEPVARKERVVDALKEILHELSGMEPDDIDPYATFLELGFESLFLTQASAAFRSRLQVEVTLRQLIEETPSLDSLADYIDASLPPEAFADEPAPEAPEDAEPASPEAPQDAAGTAVTALEQVRAAQASTGGSASLLEKVIEQQLALMARQLELVVDGRPVKDERPPAAGSRGAGDVDRLTTAGTPVQAGEKQRGAGPWKPVDKGRAGGLTARQEAHLDRLVKRLTRRTAGSKRWTETHRARLADPRTVAGFRRAWKEIVYPIVAVRSQGSRVWDVDGNEYVDVAMGFGVNMLGHSPSFVIDAVAEQLKNGVEIGPQTPLAGEVAELVCELTGMERAAFCNTGSEAVLAALRVARTVTGRMKVATFAGDYHGIFDEMLGRGISVSGERRTVPVAPGIPPRMVEDVLILDYGDPQSLEVIEEHAHELAAVLVEPVQSRRPELQPGEFLQSLRALTERTDIPLIFDEMITGFRIHPGGAQSWFDVRADLATYGKVVAGGFPIGVVTGKARYMDALDGGLWGYGDDSVPEAGVTWFAGTFVRHPAALAAARAALGHIKDRGPALQEGLNARTTRFVRELNAHFAEVGAPIRLQHFSSFFLITFESHQEFSSLFYFFLRDKGVHITEGRAAFLSTAHSDEDIELLTGAFKESVREMQEGGFLPSEDSAGTVVETDDDTRVPLTQGQLEIWLATRQGDDASRAYNISNSMRLAGPLDVEAIRAAIREIVKRHDALRATFSPTGEYQSFASDLRIDVPLIDLSSREPEARERELDALRRREVEDAFDLENGPLFRATIVRSTPELHTILLTSHHIVCDGWSLGVLMRELGVLYTAARRGESPDLAPAAQFRDYAREETEESGGPGGAAAESFWLGRFKDTPPVLELPSFRTRPRMKTYRAGRYDLPLDDAVVAALKKAGAKQGCTSFATLLAVFEAQLFRLTGLSDLVVGVTVAGQSFSGRHDLVGHCVNLLPLRSRIEGSQSFNEWVRHTRKAVLDAFDHRDYTFGTLVRKLNLPRDPSRIPLVSVTFNLDPTLQGVTFEGLEVDVRSNPRSYENFDVFFNVVDSGSGLIVECTYNADLFDETDIHRRLEEFRSLMASIAADPERAIAELDLLGEPGRRQVLVEWNDTAESYPSDRCLHELVEEVAERCPESTAITFPASRDGGSGDTTLTYRELDEAANRLGRYLRRMGVEPRALVGVHVERSAEMIVALLGILKAGAAYVPLDPAFPPDRVRLMVEDSGASVVLTESALRDSLYESDVSVVCLDADRAKIEEESDEPPGVRTDPGQLAYVMYTSGSTGRPKGVQISQRSVVNFLSTMARKPGLTEKDVLLSVTTLSFDMSVLELYLPLVVGGQVVVASRQDCLDGRRLKELLERLDVTVMQATPATWRILLESGWEGNRRLKVISGGEALQRELANELLARSGSLWNGYGPTEATVYATTARIESAEDIGIGRPVGNAQVYILDKAGQPVPIGVPGELHIGGTGLATGYRNLPELTEEKFIPNRFGDAGSRLYRTGDLVRYRPDGDIEYLGRLDHQVKIRGFRIELGEIESVLGQHPSLRDVAVVAREDSSQDRRLVAYVVDEGGGDWNTTDLRTFVARKLPDYMVPSAFIRLDALPLTPNGKVDRRALPAPDSARPELERTFVEPRTDLEKKVAGIWARVLGLERVGLHDDFFELGGHSLLATQVISRIRETLDVELGLQDLFEAPTVAGLVEQIEVVSWATESLQESAPANTGENEEMKI